MAPLTNLSEDISSMLSHLRRDEEDDSGHNINININSRSSSDSGSSPNSSPGKDFMGGRFPCCSVSDSDPRVSYGGVWTLNGTQFSTQHITTDPRSSVSLNFTGAGIAVFGVIPLSNDTFKPPTAQYFLDGVLMPERTLPFATTDIPNQPLFSTTTVLEVRAHTLVINITDAPTPYTIQRFFVPANGSTAKDMIGHIPFMSNGTLTPDSSNATHTATSTKATKTASSQMSTSTSSNEMESLGRTVRILSGILGAFVFLILIILILFFVYKCRSRRMMNTSTKETKDGSGRETTFSSWLTSTESILRNDSIFRSPPRTPRSLYSRRSEPRSGRSPSVGRISIFDGSQAPPLPPKASILIMSP